MKWFVQISSPMLVLFILVFALNAHLTCSKKLQCYCAGTADYNCPKNSNVCETDGKCYKVIEKQFNTGKIDIAYGCYSTKELQQGGFLTCRASDEDEYLRIFCCDNATMCNRYYAPNTLHTPKPDKPVDFPYPIVLVVTAVMLIIVVVMLAAGFLIWFKKRTPLPSKDIHYPISDYHDHRLDPGLTIGSGSGAGNPLLMERTIARRIEIKEVIGHGRFGEVYRGIYQGSNVAVKKFSIRDEPSWDREKEIYETHMLRHSNILGYIAADNKDEGMYTDLWIISDYHRNGSLYDFLEKNRVNKEIMLRMATSIANGLVHLHIEIPAGSQAKPPIAHRDLKSKNILVKDNLECAIADFGHAVRYFTKTNEIKGGNDDFLAGTKRYMAPEVLNGTINRNVFESFSRADVYSVALVFWEIARRSDINGQDRDYQLPYFDLVPSDPSPEVMKKVVCDEGKRPRFYPEWSMDPTLANLAKIISECWHEKQHARLSALRIKKNLVDLQYNNNQNETPDSKSYHPVAFE